MARRSTPFWTIVAATALLIVLLPLLSALPAGASPQQAPRLALTETAEARTPVTDTPRPTDTTRPTDTPGPTGTAAATDTPRPTPDDSDREETATARASATTGSGSNVDATSTAVATPTTAGETPTTTGDATPTPSPVVPEGLPRTGSTGGSPLLLLALLAVLALGAGLLARTRRQAR